MARQLPKVNTVPHDFVTVKSHVAEMPLDKIAHYVSRRSFLQTAGCLAVGSIGLAATAWGKAQSPEDSRVLPPAPTFGDDGVIYYRDAYASEMPALGVTLENWCYTTPAVRHACLKPESIFDTAIIEHDSATVRVLPRQMIDAERLRDAQVPWGPTLKDSQPISVAEWLVRSETNYLAVAHDNHVVAEICLGQMTPSTRHLLFCAAKSWLATLAAPHLANGTLDQNAPVNKYVPEFANTAFDKATVRQLLDQTTGVAYREYAIQDELAKMSPSEKQSWVFGLPEFAKAQHEYARATRISGLLPALPGEESTGYYDFILGLSEREGEHGQRFDYKDVHSQAIQLVLERATGLSYIEQSRQMAQRFGFEVHPMVMRDRVGTPIGSFGLCVAARDWLRWGMAICDMGRVGKDSRVPGVQELVDDIRSNPRPIIETTDPSEPIDGYRSHFWTVSAGNPKRKILHALGGYDQHALIDVDRGITVIQLASFWNHDSVAKSRGDTPTHTWNALWSFTNDVIPTLLK